MVGANLSRLIVSFFLDFIIIVFIPSGIRLSYLVHKVGVVKDSFLGSLDLVYICYMSYSLCTYRRWMRWRVLDATFFSRLFYNTVIYIPYGFKYSGSFLRLS